MKQDSPAGNGLGELTDQQMTQIEIDMRTMADSGYSIDDLKIPMTPEVLRLVNEIKLATRAKEAEEENLSRQMQLVEQKNSSHGRADDYAEAIQNAATREWLAADHEFAGVVHTGEEWRQIADYAKRNRQQIEQDWSDRLNPQELQKGFHLLEVLSRGPRNDEERRLVEESKRDQDMQDFVRDVDKRSGVLHERKASSHVSTDRDDEAFGSTQATKTAWNDIHKQHAESVITTRYNQHASGQIVEEVLKQSPVIQKAPSADIAL